MDDLIEGNFADGLSNIKIRSTVYFIGAISEHVLLLNCAKSAGAK